MTRLGKRSRSESRTEADAFFQEIYPFPIAAIAVASLCVGNVAIVVAALRAMG
jgi:hypothetical protein